VTHAEIAAIAQLGAKRTRRLIEEAQRDFATAEPGGTTSDDAMRDRLILGSDGVFHFENVDTRAGQAGEIQMRCTVNGMAGWLVFREGP